MPKNKSESFKTNDQTPEYKEITSDVKPLKRQKIGNNSERVSPIDRVKMALDDNNNLNATDWKEAVDREYRKLSDPDKIAFLQYRGYVVLKEQRMDIIADRYFKPFLDQKEEMEQFPEMRKREYYQHIADVISKEPSYYEDFKEKLTSLLNKNIQENNSNERQEHDPRKRFEYSSDSGTCEGALRELKFMTDNTTNGNIAKVIKAEINRFVEETKYIGTVSKSVRYILDNMNKDHNMEIDLDKASSYIRTNAPMDLPGNTEGFPRKVKNAIEQAISKDRISEASRLTKQYNRFEEIKGDDQVLKIITTIKSNAAKYKRVLLTTCTKEDIDKFLAEESINEKVKKRLTEARNVEMIQRAFSSNHLNAGLRQIEKLIISFGDRSKPDPSKEQALDNLLSFELSGISNSTAGDAIVKAIGKLQEELNKQKQL